MHEYGEGPILESRHHEGLQPKRNKAAIVAVVIGVMFVMGLGLFLMLESQPMNDQIDDADVMAEIMEEETMAEVEEKMRSLKENLEKETVEKEDGTPEFFYNRALEKEEQNDFDGAVMDYTRTIELAKKYSSEMFNALNNRGVIRAQLKEYKAAKEDFDRIINTELNRYDGNMNDTRLEAGYNNRAYVRMMMGDKDGACDDLYDALSLGIEGSAASIEKKIDQHCL